MGCCASKQGKLPKIPSTKEDIQPKSPSTKEGPARNVSRQVSSRMSPGAFVKFTRASIESEYEQIGTIGEGAFGSVQKVRHLQTGQERALKTIVMTQDSNHEQILEEIEIMKELDHPNIVKVHRIFETDNSYAIAMELCTGGELMDVILEKKALTENEAARYMLDLVSALNYMHSNGIVHRDIKPENLIFENDSEDAQIKLIDFGTAVRLEPGKKLTEFVGTSYYIPPEVIKEKYDEKCDVWSTGVLLFVLLSGYPPFNGKRTDDLFKTILKAPLQFKQLAWKTISPEAIDLLKKMLNKNPKRRPSFSEILYHPWLYKRANNQVPDKPLAVSAIKTLGTFTMQSKLERATLSFIAAQLLSLGETKELRELFHAIDINKDGKLSCDELSEGLHRYGMTSIIDINKVLEACDADGNGYIDYNEFLTATVDWTKSMNSKRLYEAFKLYDIDGDGTISFEELKRTLGEGEENEDHYFMSMINEADVNGDGVLSFEEFTEYMMRNVEVNPKPTIEDEAESNRV